MLEHKIDNDTFENLDSAIQAEYSQEGDSHFLQVGGMVVKARLDEFRQNNISLKETMEEMTLKNSSMQSKLDKALEGGDPAKLEAAIEEGLINRTKAMQEEHSGLLDNSEKARIIAETSLNKLLISDAVSREAISSGVKDTALEDLLMRASSVFKIKDGKATPFNGDEIIYGKDATTPLSMKEWLAGQAISAPHLFKDNTGGGAEQNNSGGATGNKTLTSTQKIAEGLKNL